MKAAIIDDEMKDATALAEKLEKYEGITMAGIARNGKDGIELANSEKPDVMFLDIELPDISGIDLIERINATASPQCRVVMYTAYGRFMLPAFRNKAFDFLVKPIDDEELSHVIKRLCIDQQANMQKAQSQTGSPHKGEGKFLLYTNSIDFRIVDIRDIGVFKYNNSLRVWEVYISGKKETVKLKRNVKSEDLLGIDQSLVRVSQSHIINVTYLLEVVDNVCKFYPPFDKIEGIKVGRMFKKKLIDKFLSL